MSEPLAKGGLALVGPAGAQAPLPAAPVPAQAPLPAAPVPAEAPAQPLDGRRPERLASLGAPLVVASGHADLFALRSRDGAVAGPRRHLLRIESGGIILPVPADAGAGGERLEIIAVGTPGTAVREAAQAEIGPLCEGWVLGLAALVAGPHPAWDIREAASGEALEPGERRRGPARALRWVVVEEGSAAIAGQAPAYRPGDPPAPLGAGLWAQAGPEGCRLSPCAAPEGDLLALAVDRFHRAAAAALHGEAAGQPTRDAARLARRADLDAARAAELFGRLGSIVVRRDAPPAAVDPEDPLMAACALVAGTMAAPLTRPAGRVRTARDYRDVVEIARASRLRVRRVLLRAEWWRQDAGPLLAWRGEAGAPVALLRERRAYLMVDPATGERRRVDAALAAELGPEAAGFYPTLPGRALSFRDLLAFAARRARGNLASVAVPAVLMGLLTLVVPLITQALVNSAIPRSELDQITVCAIALAVTALAAAAVQAAESLAMLRLEGLIDWTLQAAMIDRLLRLRAALFRDHTVGDLVDRAMGIDAVRRLLTGRTLRSLLAGMFGLFSIALMLVYDPVLALIAVALALLRGVLILAASGLRLYHESRAFNGQGRVQGFVLQLFAGIGKLRVAGATVRALAVWSRLFTEQKGHFLAAQRIANGLSIAETALPTLATLAIFAAASTLGSTLTQNLGAFLGFFAAFGQTMGAIGAFAAGLSEALVAIPHLTRMRPLLAAEAEIADDRKPPGDLSGAIEVSRLTFRYGASGPPVLDAVSLRIAAGEYVAIVGPSGSGKSSLLRLLLGFEAPESGAVFYDGKALDTLDVSAVRRQLGVVLQNGRLTTGSLYENICGGVQLPLEQAWEAARMAGLEGDIRAMPMGMHTVVAEGVNTLSGGQRQRLLIARAIARRPRILLFDEATSALDNRSQAVVSASLGALNVTRIVIAHRLSTVREADRIVVLAEGRIVQSGTFDDLAAAPGLFADFARRQLL
ncbi:ABC transporter related [Methylobacterium sp. 4-46]|uniref:NHLP bacteriocin export ABC transporter permease/ATPase subunit n=1 Tax=unclassified Methylobacterium TaxID=2615210 RepID=UPI000165C6C1|nr:MULTISPECIES: NHLP bacteriocin export ABC transporter permease/ATPase subunit [Methylobacterium]ACA14676.1 ABC transporter related [Methylobacterium sp. 4-46]WFT80429.1 NHLP bacteriocin export ABC transporter permease/ATPase subunit [Methylobacterium nodulans]